MARIDEFRTWLAATGAPGLDGYADLQRWSVDHLDEFWDAVWRHAGIVGERGDGPALAERRMPGAVWFPGARLNYADQVLRHAGADPEGPAIIGLTEPGGPQPVSLSWRELRRQVAALAGTFRDLGVGPGDRVAGYLPNIPEAIVALLATAAVGAVWSSCGQDYAPAAAADRLAQLDPVLLVTADGYRYGGRDHDKVEDVAELTRRLPSLRATLLVERSGRTAAPLRWEDATSGDPPLATEAVDFTHPLWVLFSSGTTGKPKGIVHGHGGVVLEHVKQIALHLDLGPGDRYWWYTSPSWMMWNFLVAGLLVGATVITYDGSPAFPRPDSLFELAARHRVRVLGSSPAYLLACEKAGARPGEDHDLGALETLGVTGSVMPTASYHWVHDAVGDGVTVASVSGGTDVVSCFAGWAPGLRTWPGELSAPCLGTALDAWDPSGHPVRGQVGELVVTEPMPSMPVMFWDDPDGARYRAAYFEPWPGVWRHGDWITLTERGSVIIHGRSDSTLNRQGVRMGSAEIYEAVESLPEVREALVVGVEGEDGGYWMPLFVALADGVELDDRLTERIRTAVRTLVSPRHVPDDVIAVPGIPHTRTGKKLEVPVKRLLTGGQLGSVVDPGAVDDPALLESFAALRRPAG